MTKPEHCHLLHSPQHVLNPREPDADPLQAEFVLPIHSPLLKQSLLLAVPPLSDMLKFSGLLHVHQVTFNWVMGPADSLGHCHNRLGSPVDTRDASGTIPHHTTHQG